MHLKSILVVSGLLGGAVSICGAVDLNVTEDFENQSIGGWLGGGGGTILADASPVGGNYVIKVTSGPKLGMKNETAGYTGDYLAAGVTGVEAWFKNTSTQTLHLRMVLFSRVDRWTSREALVLAPGSGWVRHTFSVAESSLLHVQGTKSYAASLASMNRLMFRHDPVGAATVPSITATMSVDNIRVRNTRSIFGTVVLQDWAGSVAGQAVDVVLADGNGPLWNGLALLDSAGKFGVEGEFAPGNYTVFVKASHWLQRSASLSLTGLTGSASFSLINGDVDGDNEIGSSDLSALSSAFLSSSGDGNWNEAADLDGDGEVGSADLSALSANFLLAGDAP